MSVSDTLVATARRISRVGRPSPGSAPGWGRAEVARFWDEVDACSPAPQPRAELLRCPAPEPRDEFRFTRHSYTVLESADRVTVGVMRAGSGGTARTQVWVKTSEHRGGGFQAKPGLPGQGRADYVHVEAVLQFEPGDTVKTFDVLILGDEHWEPTRWFEVELASASSGRCDGAARVFIVDTSLFPKGIRPDQRESVYHQTKCFFLQWRAARGEKF